MEDNVHHSPIVDKKPSGPEPRTLESQLRRPKRVSKLNLRYANFWVISIVMGVNVQVYTTSNILMNSDRLHRD